MYFLIQEDWSSTAKALGGLTMCGIAIVRIFLHEKLLNTSLTLPPVKVKNWEKLRISFRRSGVGSLKRIQTSHIRECGSGCTWKGKKITHLWLDMVRNLHPLVYNFTILAFLFRPRVTPWELTLGVLESGSTLLERLKVTFMRLKSCSPIEAQRKMGRKKGRRLYSFTAKLPLSFGTRIDGDEETEVNS